MFHILNLEMPFVFGCIFKHFMRVLFVPSRKVEIENKIGDAIVNAKAKHYSNNMTKTDDLESPKLVFLCLYFYR